MLLAVNGVVQLGSRGFFFSRNSSKHVDPHQLDLYIYIIYNYIYIYITATLAILFQGADIYMFFFPRCSEVEYVEAGANRWQDLTRWSTQTKVNVGLHKNPMI